MSETEERRGESRIEELKRRLAIDLAGLSASDLTELREAAEAQRREVVDRQVSEAFAEFQARIKESGVSLAAVLSRHAPELLRTLAKTQRARHPGAGHTAEDRRPAKRAPIVFADPDNPRNTWAERGQKPKWLRDYEEAGRNPEQFRIRPRKTAKAP